MADAAKFAGKVYIVTGGTQGIGRAVAMALAEAGAEAHYVHADLTLSDDCRAVTAACDARFGRLDGLVNVAGDNQAGGIDDATIELWDHMFAVNVRAPFIMMQGAIAIMRREGIQGSIVNVVSMVSHGGNRMFGIYSVTKGALATLTKNVAQAVRSERIRVNGLNPGWADTPGEHAARSPPASPRTGCKRPRRRSPSVS